MSANNLEINSTPDHLEKPDESGDVKKMNKNPLIIVAVVVLLAIMGLLYAASTRNQPNSTQSTPSAPTEIREGESDAKSDHGAKMVAELENKNSSPLGADPLLDSNTTYNQQPINVVNGQGQELGLQPIQSNPMARNQSNYNGNLGSPPPVNFRQQAQQEFDMQRIKYAQKAFDVPSKTGLNTEPPSSQTQGGTPTPVSLMDKYLSQLNLSKSGEQAAISQSDKNRNFIAESVSYDYLAAQKAPQKSPFEIKTGTIIPGVMLTGINSDLPGKIKAQVSENIYDTATGKYMLIPQGTVIIGDYSSNVIYGQARVLVAWNRLVFPDGHVLNIGNMNGMDKSGYAGFSDQVDNHYFRIFSSALLMSAISGGVASADKGSGGSTPQTQSTSDSMVASAIQQLGAVGTKMIEKNLDISPTLMIRPGYKFSIFITKDLKLEPLKLKLN